MRIENYIWKFFLTERNIIILIYTHKFVKILKLKSATQCLKITRRTHAKIKTNQVIVNNPFLIISKDRVADIVFYEIETRFRKMIYELVEPVHERSKKDREEFDTLSKRLNEVEFRVVELEDITLNKKKPGTMFDDIFKKINDLDAEVKGENKEMWEKINEAHKKVDENMLNYSQIKQKADNVEKMTSKMLSDYSKTAEELTDFRVKTGKIMDELLKTTHKFGEDLKNFTIKTEENFIRKQTQINDIRNQGTQNEVGLGNFKVNMQEAQGKIFQMEKKVSDLDHSVVSFQKYIDSINRTRYKTENVELLAKTLENYMDKYLPMYTQAQMSDTLHAILPRESRRRLILYEDKKFREFNSGIIRDKGEANITKKIEKAYELLEPTIKRYARQSVAWGMGLNHRDVMDYLQINQRNSARLDTDRSQEKNQNSPRDEKNSHQDQRNDPPTSNTPKQDVKVDLTAKPASAEQENPEDFEDLDKKKDDDDLGMFLSPKEFEDFLNKMDTIKKDCENQIKKVHETLKASIEFVSLEKHEITANAEIMIQDTYREVQSVMDQIRKDRITNELQVGSFGETVNKTAKEIEKFNKWSHKLNAILILIGESLTGVMMILFKEEKEKKAVMQMIKEQPSIDSSNLNSYQEDILKKSFYKEKYDRMEKIKKQVDRPYLVGTKISIDSAKADDNEIKIKYNDEMLPKTVFLENMIESIRGHIKNIIPPKTAKQHPTIQTEPNEKTTDIPITRQSGNIGYRVETPSYMNTSQKIQTEEGIIEGRRASTSTPGSRLSTFRYNNYKTFETEPKNFVMVGKRKLSGSSPKTRMNKTFC